MIISAVILQLYEDIGLECLHVWDDHYAKTKLVPPGTFKMVLHSEQKK